MLSSQQTLYPSMRFISSCMTELVSSTERRTFTAAYKELSSGAIATRPRTRAGPPTYRKPLDALLGVNVRTPTREQQQAQKHTAKKRSTELLWFFMNLPKCPISAAPIVRAVPLRCWLILRARNTGVELSRDVISIWKATLFSIIIE